MQINGKSGKGSFDRRGRPCLFWTSQCCCCLAGWRGVARCLDDGRSTVHKKSLMKTNMTASSRMRMDTKMPPASSSHSSPFYRVSRRRVLRSVENETTIHATKRGTRKAVRSTSIAASSTDTNFTRRRRKGKLDHKLSSVWIRRCHIFTSLWSWKKVFRLCNNPHTTL